MNQDAHSDEKQEGSKSWNDLRRSCAMSWGL